jgi:pimeloyl-ACP methyl ester carboxylesterase
MPLKAMTPTRDPTLSQAGFAWVSDVGGVARALRNLSGLGAGGLIGKLAPQRAAARRIDLQLASGEAIAVQVAGQGRPVLMIHGLGGSHHDWDGAVESLAGRHTIHRFDLLGHGERAATQRKPSLWEMAHDVAQVIDGLALERPLLVGHSMGALVVMRYLQDHGETRIAGVCLIDQSPRITTDDDWKLGLFGSLTRAQVQHTLGRLRGDFVETVATEFLAKLAPLKRAGSPDALAGRLARWAVAKLARSCGAERLMSMLESLAEADFRDVIAKLTVPTMVVLGGASNHYGGLPLGEYYQDTLPDGTVRMYKTASHSPHQQEPGRFAADLAAFAAKRCA